MSATLYRYKVAPIFSDAHQRYPDAMANPDHIAAVAAATERYAQARANLEAAILAALRAPDARPTRIAEASPWTPAYVRAFGRKHGIEPPERYRKPVED